jgi:hypothetical protein
MQAETRSGIILPDAPLVASAAGNVREYREAVTGPSLMKSDGAVKMRDDNMQLQSLLSEWYARNPDIRRLWVYEGGENDSGRTGEIRVTVALIPVCDSDDTSPIWLARCTRWQRQLEGLLECRVNLDRFDGEPGEAPGAKGSEWKSVCLASIAWRDCCSADFRS